MRHLKSKIKKILKNHSKTFIYDGWTDDNIDNAIKDILKVINYKERK